MSVVKQVVLERQDDRSSERVRNGSEPSSGGYRGSRRRQFQHLLARALPAWNCCSSIARMTVGPRA